MAKSDPSESPSGRDAAASSPGSAATTSGGPFLGDPGPAFDPKAPAAEPEPAAATLHALPELELGWEEEQVRNVLRAQGAATHALVGVAESDWKHTENDLAAIAPPLTRILNRHDVTRAAAGTADELGLIVGLGGYVSRSWRERRAALELLAGAEPEPVSGVAAPAGTGPPPVEAEPPLDEIPDIDNEGEGPKWGS